MPKFEIVDSRTVRDSDGREHDVIEAIGALPWVSQLCPQMPHQYVVLGKSDPLAYGVLEAMVRSSNPDSYRAYFRGYQSPNRYWEAPDGLRYWSTRFMLNRCPPDSVEPLRRVADGAKPVRDWKGPPYAPNGIGMYEQDAKGRWWPTEAALAGGYQPCRACLRAKKPPSTTGRRTEPPRQIMGVTQSATRARFAMIRRTGIRLPEADREGILQAFRDRLAAGVELGDNRQDAFGGNILTQAEIAEKFHVIAGTVTRMAIDYEDRMRAGVDPSKISV